MGVKVEVADVITRAGKLALYSKADGPIRSPLPTSVLFVVRCEKSTKQLLSLVLKKSL